MSFEFRPKLVTLTILALVVSAAAFENRQDSFVETGISLRSAGPSDNYFSVSLLRVISLPE